MARGLESSSGLLGEGGGLSWLGRKKVAMASHSGPLNSALSLPLKKREEKVMQEKEREREREREREAPFNWQRILAPLPASAVLERQNTVPESRGESASFFGNEEFGVREGQYLEEYSRDSAKLEWRGRAKSVGKRGTHEGEEKAVNFEAASFEPQNPKQAKEEKFGKFGEFGLGRRVEGKESSQRWNGGEKENEGLSEQAMFTRSLTVGREPVKLKSRGSEWVSRIITTRAELNQTQTRNKKSSSSSSSLPLKAPSAVPRNFEKKDRKKSDEEQSAEKKAAAVKGNSKVANLYEEGKERGRKGEDDIIDVDSPMAVSLLEKSEGKNYRLSRSQNGKQPLKGMQKDLDRWMDLVKSENTLRNSSHTGKSGVSHESTMENQAHSSHAGASEVQLNDIEEPQAGVRKGGEREGEGGEVKSTMLSESGEGEKKENVEEGEGGGVGKEGVNGEEEEAGEGEGEGEEDIAPPFGAAARDRGSGEINAQLEVKRRGSFKKTEVPKTISRQFGKPPPHTFIPSQSKAIIPLPPVPVGTHRRSLKGGDEDSNVNGGERRKSPSRRYPPWNGVEEKRSFFEGGVVTTEGEENSPHVLKCRKCEAPLLVFLKAVREQSEGTCKLRCGQCSSTSQMRLKRPV